MCFVCLILNDGATAANFIVSSAEGRQLNLKINFTLDHPDAVG